MPSKEKCVLSNVSRIRSVFFKFSSKEERIISVSSYRFQFKRCVLFAVHWMNIGPELDSGGAIFKALYLFLMKFLS